MVFTISIQGITILLTLLPKKDTQVYKSVDIDCFGIPTLPPSPNKFNHHTRNEKNIDAA